MMKFRRKKRDEDTNGWMITFSDVMTLLLVFFVFLYSLSVIDQQKFKQFVVSFQNVGVFDKGDGLADKNNGNDPLNNNSEVPDLEDPNKNALYDTYVTVKKYIQQNNLGVDISVRFSDRGVVLEIKDKILFESAQADLKPEAKIILNEISKLLAEIPNSISVEGHTDNRPIHNGRFPSNWELSTARSLAVVRYMSEDLGLEAKRFCAIGYGEYRPRVVNDSPENMATNRRVTIVINAEDVNEQNSEQKSKDVNK